MSIVLVYHFTLQRGYPIGPGANGYLRPSSHVPVSHRLLCPMVYLPLWFATGSERRSMEMRTIEITAELIQEEEGGYTLFFLNSTSILKVKTLTTHLPI
jgi:hypothetical protein